MGLNEGVVCEKYLGLPLWIGRNKKTVSDFLRAKMQKKLQPWKGNRFSIGRKEFLIKFVAQAIESYSMGMFKIPAIICHQLQTMIIS